MEISENTTTLLNNDPVSYKNAAVTLVFCLQDSNSPDYQKLVSWQGKNQFYQELILQQRSDAPLNQFLHFIASQQSSGSKWVLPAVANEISPALQELCSKPTIHKNTVLCLLLLREFIPNWITQKQITELHLEHFKSFSLEDLSLPYSYLFENAVYHRNVEDLKQVSLNNNFKLHHILLLVWVLDLSVTDFLHLDCIQDRTEYSIAKTLFMRYADRISKFDPSLFKSMMEQFDKEGNFFHLIESIIRIKQQLNDNLSKKPSKFLKKLMNHRIYQGGQIIKNLLSSGLTLSRNRPKIAVCISGQLRGYREAFATWKKHLLINADFDIYVHSWNKVGGSGAEPFRQALPFEGLAFQTAYRDCCTVLGFDEVKRLYPALFNALGKSEMIDVETLKNFYSTDHVILEDEKSEEFAGFTNSQKMHYKIYACHQFALSQNKHYDLIIRVRPDLPFGFCGFSWNDIIYRCNSAAIIFADHPMGIHYMHLMMGDQFAVSTPEVMSIYSNTWKTLPVLSNNQIYETKMGFAGHVSLAMVCWAHGIEVEKAPIKKGKLVDIAPLSKSDIYQALCKDAESRDFIWDKKLMNACQIH